MSAGSDTPGASARAAGASPGRRWTPGLQAQLILGVTAVHLLLVVAFTYDVVTRQRAFLAEQSREQVAGLARVLALNSSSWVLANDVVGLGEVVSAVRDQPHLRYAMVVDARGRVLAHTATEQVGRHLVDAPSRALLEGPPAPRVVHADEALLDVAAPVRSSTGACIGWVRVGQGQEAIAQSLAAVRRNGVLYGLAATALGALFAAMVAFRLSARIRHLLSVSQRVRDGRTDLRSGLDGRDELAELGAGFDAMLDGIQARERENARLEAELLHAQRLESVGRLAGGVAHDFNNLLTAIVGNAEALQQELPEGEQRESAREILEAGRRATEVTRGLLVFSRKQLVSPVRLDLRELVRGTERLLARLIGEDVEVVVQVPDAPLEITGNRGQLEQVLMNLATNARDAMPDGGTLTVEARKATLAEPEVRARGLGSGRLVVVTVRDTGVGMDAATRARIFDPFFTTKEVGKGTGLGLAMAYGIVRQHGGFIDVQSEPGRGTDFQIFLPLEAPGSALTTPAPAGLAEAPAVHGPARGAMGLETILLAEDDATVRTFAVRVLEGAGYRVVAAADGDEAVAAFLAHRGEIRLCLFDLVMPRRSGPAAFQLIRAQDPAMRVLFSSGYSPEATARELPNVEAASLLEKPYLPGSLLARVRAALDQPGPARAGAGAPRREGPPASLH